MQAITSLKPTLFKPLISPSSKMGALTNEQAKDLAKVLPHMDIDNKNHQIAMITDINHPPNQAGRPQFYEGEYVTLHGLAGISRFVLVASLPPQGFVNREPSYVPQKDLATNFTLRDPEAIKDLAKKLNVIL